MSNKDKNIYGAIFAVALATLAAIPSQTKAIFSYETNYACQEARVWHRERNSGIERTDITCKRWQWPTPFTASGQVEIGACVCYAPCLMPATNPNYHSSTITDGSYLQADKQKITAPVMFTWVDLNKTGPDHKNTAEYRKSTHTDPGAYFSTKYGPFPQSYRVEFLNESGKFNTNDKSTYISRVVQKEQLNSLEQLGSCFFNSSTKNIKWRVLPCCDANGTSCMPADRAPWWSFSTSSAPELIGATDASHSTPIIDPDWNGPQASTVRMDFCSVELKWCKAKLLDKDEKSVNHNEDYALSYQMMVKYNEYQALGLSSSGGILNYIKGAITDRLRGWFSDAYNKAMSVINSSGNSSEYCHYLLQDKNNSSICNAKTLGPIPSGSSIPRTSFAAGKNPSRDLNFFTKNLVYSWKLRRCFDNSNAKQENCNITTGDENYGQIWKFITIDQGAIAAPSAIYPPNDKNAYSREEADLTEIPTHIAWSTPCGANSFIYDIKKIDTETGTETTLLKLDNAETGDGGLRTTANQISLETQANNFQALALEPDTAYKWRVTACWPSLPISTNVCEPKNWSEIFTFRTTGRPPKADSLKVEDENISSVTFSWESVKNAKSYWFEMVNTSSVGAIKNIGPELVKTNEITLQYPKIVPQSGYQWKVRTCADDAGLLCGARKASANYSVKIFLKPENPNLPADNKPIEKIPDRITWSGKGDSFKVNLTYKPDASAGLSIKCNSDEIKIKDKTVQAPYLDMPADMQQYCAGEYIVTVQPCFGLGCETPTNSTATWRFNVEAPSKVETEAGFTVCGKNYDNIDTKDWDETDRCELKHIFLTIKIMTNFILFRLSLILLPLLGLATGVIFYTAGGHTETIGAVKRMWKYVGIGYALMIFAWLIVSGLMGIMGYKEIWWKISLLDNSILSFIAYYL